VPRVDDRHTGAEVTARVIQYGGRFEMRKASLWGKSCQIEKRAIGNDGAGDRIYSRRTRTIRAGAITSGMLVKLSKIILSTLELGLGLPRHSTLVTPIMVGWGRKIVFAFRRR